MYRHEVKLKVLKMAGDIIITIFSFLISFILVNSDRLPGNYFLNYGKEIILLIIFTIVVFSILEMYSVYYHKNFREIVFMIISTGGLITIYHLVLNYLVDSINFPRNFFIVFFLVFVVFMLVWRYSVMAYEVNINYNISTVIIGKGKEVNLLIKYIKKNYEEKFIIKGIVIDEINDSEFDKVINDKFKDDNKPLICNDFMETEKLIEDIKPDVVIIADNGLKSEIIEELISAAQTVKTRIYLISEFYDW